MTEMTDKKRKIIDQLWSSLGNILVDENDNIEQGWRHFPVGTSKFYIWHWIEEKYDISIAEDLINSITEQE